MNVTLCCCRGEKIILVGNIFVLNEWEKGLKDEGGLIVFLLLLRLLKPSTTCVGMSIRFYSQTLSYFRWHWNRSAKKNDNSCHQSQDLLILSLYLLLASFLLLFSGEKKEQDIFAGPGSGKQRKQGLEYSKQKPPKSLSPPSNIPSIYFWCRQWRMEPAGCVNSIFGLFLVNFTFGLFLAMHCLKMCLFCCTYIWICHLCSKNMLDLFGSILNFICLSP